MSDIKVAYVCDRKACNGCSVIQNPECSHAVNFKKFDDEHYIEVADISHPITK